MLAIYTLCDSQKLKDNNSNSDFVLPVPPRDEAAAERDVVDGTSSDNSKSILNYRTEWKLPFKNNLNTRSHSFAMIKEEFRRLDILSEGRLTLLNLQSALQLREVKVSDHIVREWFRQHDRGAKGYITFDDYIAIYEAETVAANGVDTLLHSDKERLYLLRKAFNKYDVDCDGFISTEDLRIAFTAQGKSFIPADLHNWVQNRDLSNIGSVCFEDFVKHFK